MKIAVPREIRSGERRVALVPESVKKLVKAGIGVTVERGAGEAAFFTDSLYREEGAEVEGVRNVLIAIGNSGDPALAAVAEERLDDVSPLVRGAAVWALGRLLPKHSFAALRAARRPAETDLTVAAEWGASLG